jgi:hypothetical protein
MGLVCFLLAKPLAAAADDFAARLLPNLLARLALIFFGFFMSCTSNFRRMKCKSY